MEKLYTKDMKQFITSIFPKEVFRTRANYAAFGLACWTVAMLVLQLFAFEKFPDTFRGLPSDAQTWLAVAIVAVELMSLHFLLSMNLPRAVRRFSGVLAVVAPTLWFVASMYALLSGESIALFGALVSRLPSSVYAVLSVVWLSILAVCLRRLVFNRNRK